MSISSTNPAPPVPSSQHDLGDKGEMRFEFGKNWQRFLRRLNQQRILEAESSLKETLGCESLVGKQFLDVGSGSGLFSLAARRLGAAVLSFDYDLNSVACTRELKRRFFPADQDWRIERGSALDQDYLRGLGRFDVVYSWGVLHHTGDMWLALQNMIPLVRKGGKLFLAIYNDQGGLSRFWLAIKKAYNSTHKSVRFVILWPIASAILAALTVKDLVRLRRPGILSRRYDPRGMSLWSDVVDWVGGYPFEVASRNRIIDFYQSRGFHLDRLVSCGRKSGCNQYIFVQAAEDTTRYSGRQDWQKNEGSSIKT